MRLWKAVDKGNASQSLDLGHMGLNSKRSITSNQVYRSQFQTKPQTYAQPTTRSKQSIAFDTGKKTVRGRIDKYGNLVSPENIPKIPPVFDKEHVSTHEQKFLKSKRAPLSRKQAENEIIKFYGKMCCGDELFRQLPSDLALKSKDHKTSIITSSNHYRYNRIREGGWGARVPKPSELEIPFVSSISQFVSRQKQISSSLTAEDSTHKQLNNDSQLRDLHQRTAVSKCISSQGTTDLIKDLETDQSPREIDLEGSNYIAEKKKQMFQQQNPMIRQSNFQNSSIFESRESKNELFQHSNFSNLQQQTSLQIDLLDNSIGMPQIVNTQTHAKRNNIGSLNQSIQSVNQSLISESIDTRRSNLGPFQEENSSFGPVKKAASPKKNISKFQSAISYLNNYSSKNKAKEELEKTLTITNAMPDTKAHDSASPVNFKGESIIKDGQQSDDKTRRNPLTSSCSSDKSVKSRKGQLPNRINIVQTTQHQESSHIASQLPISISPRYKQQNSDERKLDSVMKYLQNLEVKRGVALDSPESKGTKSVWDTTGKNLPLISDSVSKNMKKISQFMDKDSKQYQVKQDSRRRRASIQGKEQKNLMNILVAPLGQSKSNNEGRKWREDPPKLITFEQLQTFKAVHQLKELQKKQADMKNKKKEMHNIEKIMQQQTKKTMETGEVAIMKRRQREVLERQMQTLREQIKEKKKNVEQKKTENEEILKSIVNQVGLYQRLTNLEQKKGALMSIGQTNSSIGMQTQNSIRDGRDEMKSRHSQQYPEYPIYTEKLPGNNTAIQSTIQKERPSLEDAKASFDGEQSFNDSILQDSHHNRWASALPSIGTPSNAGVQKADIHGLYRFLFENDLKQTRERTLDQLRAIQEKHESNIHEAEMLKLENIQLKNHIRRYQKLIKEGKESKFDGFPRHDLNISKQQSSSSYAVQKGRTATNFEHDVLYKYNVSPFRHMAGTETSSMAGGNAQNNDGNSLKINSGLSHGFQSRAGGMQSVNNPHNQVLDIKKAEVMTSIIPHILKQTKSIDSIVLTLQMMKQVLKATKITLFLLDPSLYGKIIVPQKDRKQHYRKVDLGQNLLYALYNQETDFISPKFADVDELKEVMTQREFVLPIPDLNGKSPFMLLQIMSEGRKKGVKKSVSPEKVKQKLTKLSKNMGKKSVDRKTPSSNNEATSKVSLSTQNKFHLTHQGWTHNDWNLVRLMTHYLSMLVSYFIQLVVQQQKTQKISQVIDFSKEMMDVRTFRQITKVFKRHMQPLIGFESCSVFFENWQTGDIFTVAGEDSEQKPENKNPNYIDTSYAKELIFPEDQVVIFPTTMGISGEVHKKMGIKYDNQFGKVISKPQYKRRTIASDFTSEISSQIISPLTKKTLGVKDMVSSQLAKVAKGNLATPFGHQKTTALENIDEENPQAEAEGILQFQNKRKSQQGEIIHKINFNQSNIEFDQQNIKQAETIKELLLSDIRPDKDIRLQPSNLILEDDSADHTSSKKPTKLGEGENSFDPEDSQQQVPKSKKKKQFYKKPSIHGNINDLQSKRMRKKKTLVLSNKKSKAAETGGTIYSEFVPDIDNFEGVKEIRNYCIVALKDNGYTVGEQSVGLLHLFNKLEGTKNIEKEDIARIQCLSRFLGALAVKAHSYTNSLTLLIGMTICLKETHFSIDQMDSRPGLGVYNLLQLPIDVMQKHLSDQEEKEKEWEHHLSQLKNI